MRNRYTLRFSAFSLIYVSALAILCGADIKLPFPGGMLMPALLLSLAFVLTAWFFCIRPLLPAGGRRRLRASGSHDGQGGSPADLGHDILQHMSHDLRSPLTSVGGYAQAILDGTIPRESQDKYLQVIILMSHKMEQSVQQMLAMYDLTEHRVELYPSYFDITHVISDMASTCSLLYQKKEIHFAMEADPSLPKVYADLNQITQVLYCLMDNAAKFSPPGAGVSIRVELTSGKQDAPLRIVVEDHGIGIAEEDLQHIQEPFYKADKSRDTLSGIGLGLTIVSEILHCHGSRLEIASVPESGSTFSFTLPVCKADFDASAILYTSPQHA